MDVKFDPAKDAINMAKHGLSLGEAIDFDMAGAVVEPDDRFDYGEPRFRAFGRVEGDDRCLVFTVIGKTIRVISYRHAHAKEMRRHGLQKTPGRIRRR